MTLRYLSAFALSLFVAAPAWGQSDMNYSHEIESASSQAIPVLSFKFGQKGVDYNSLAVLPKPSFEDRALPPHKRYELSDSEFFKSISSPSELDLEPADFKALGSASLIASYTAYLGSEMNENLDETLTHLAYLKPKSLTDPDTSSARIVMAKASSPSASLPEITVLP